MSEIPCRVSTGLPPYPARGRGKTRLISGNLILLSSGLGRFGNPEGSRPDLTIGIDPVTTDPKGEVPIFR